MDSPGNQILEAAHARGWLTSEQVAECLRVLETVQEVGLDQDLGQILLRKGFLDKEKIRQLKRELSQGRIGKYTLVRRIGKGGAGVVYLARQEPLGRTVALKVLSDRRTDSKTYLDDLYREARIAVTLNHENIVRGLEFGEADGYHFFAMEYVDGEPLSALVKREGHLGERHAFSIAAQVVRGLRHAAALDLVHHDVKPQNILVTASGVAKICDLGLASLSLRESAQISEGKAAVGTPAYMSPEKIRMRGKGDFRSDIYALGATLFCMVTGRTPFMAETMKEIIRLHLHEPVPDPREWNIKLSPSAAAVITRMLAKNPSERYSSYDDLLADLVAVADGRPPLHALDLGRAAPVSIPGALTRASSRREALEKRTRSPLLLLVGLTAVAAVVVGVVSLMPSDGESDPSATSAEKAQPPEPPSAADVAWDPAADLFRAAEAHLVENPDAPLTSKISRFELIIRKYPDSKWALDAGDRIREINAERLAAVEEHRAAAESEWDALRREVAELTESEKYGLALERLSGYPQGFADTEFVYEVREEEKRVRSLAKELRDNIFHDVGWMVEAGSLSEAIALLERLERSGVPEHVSEARAKKKEVMGRASSEAKVKARAALQAQVEDFLTRAFALAEAGDQTGAEAALRRAAGESDFTSFDEELTAALGCLREALRFDAAVLEGAKAWVGRTETLRLLDPSTPSIRAVIVEVRATGMRLIQGERSLLVPFRDLVPETRLRLAFQILDLRSAADHLAAASHLVVHGLLDPADTEAQLAEGLDGDPRTLRAVSRLHRSGMERWADSQAGNAEILLAQKRWQDAKEALAAASRRVPWSSRLHLLLGRVFVGLEDDEAALDAFERAGVAGSEDPEVYFLQGEVAFRLGHYEKALTALTRYVEASSEGARNVAAARGLLAQLRTRVTEARVKDLLTLAGKSFRRRDWQEVIKTCAEIFALQPEQPEAWFLEASAYLKLNDILQSYLGFRRYLEIDPDGSRSREVRSKKRDLEARYGKTSECALHLFKGTEELQQGRYDSALRSFQKAVRTGPICPEGYVGRARAAVKLAEKGNRADNLTAAIDDFGTALKLDPGQVQILEERSVCYYVLERYAEAARDAEAAARKLPNRWEAWNLAGIAHSARGRSDQAIRAFTSGLQRAPREAALHINRALAYEALGRFEEAAADLESAKRDQPNPDQAGQINAILDRIVKKRYGDD